MKKNVDISNFYGLNTLERAHYEVTTRQNILNFMSINDMLNTESYHQVFEEHIVMLKIYEDLKIDFSQWMLNNKIIDASFNGVWNINFRMKEVELDDKI